MGWTHRERFLAALNLEAADRVPIDFGTTFATTITVGAYDRLKAHLGLDHETEVLSDINVLAAPHAAVLERFGVDTRRLSVGAFAGEQGWIDAESFRDEWGTLWRRAEGGPAMPVDGPFFHLEEPSIGHLEEHEWPDPDNPGYYRGLGERARELRAETEFAIVLSLPTMIVHQGQFMRGFADWLKDLRRHREFIDRMLAITTDMMVRHIENTFNAVGANADAVFTGDDLASQAGPMFSPEIYRELVKPYHRRIMATIKECSEAKIMYHSCGAILPLIEDLIDIGVDAINPIQVSARDMEPAKLKETFGDRVAFWGGIDTQRLLPYGTPDEVRDETDRIVDVLGRGGGYILGSVHNIQAEVPPENIVAMFETARAHPLGRA